jgi:hypothetical protein
MYYIAHDSFLESDTIAGRIVKRLKDFNPEDGEEYIVRKSRSDVEYQIYKGVDGKLKKTLGSIISINSLLTF